MIDESACMFSPITQTLPHQFLTFSDIYKYEISFCLEKGFARKQYFILLSYFILKRKIELTFRALIC